jgi:hypothetical protein
VQCLGIDGFQTVQCVAAHWPSNLPGIEQRKLKKKKKKKEAACMQLSKSLTRILYLASILFRTPHGD